jgi:hypothetical protein
MPPVNAFEETLSYISTAELYYNTWKADKLRNEKMWANSEFLLAGQHIYLMHVWLVNTFTTYPRNTIYCMKLDA